MQRKETIKRIPPHGRLLGCESRPFIVEAMCLVRPAEPTPIRRGSGQASIGALINLNQVEQITIVEKRHDRFLSQLLQIVAADSPGKGKALGVFVNRELTKG
jgi:hypothetical protein